MPWACMAAGFSLAYIFPTGRIWACLEIMQAIAAASCQSSGRLLLPVEQRPKVVCSTALTASSGRG